MSKYEEIKGTKLKNYTEDPDNPYVGQLWYNTAIHSFRIRKSSIGSAWSTGGSLNTARRLGGSAGISSSAAQAYGGYIGPANSGLNEIYNGSAWTEVND